MIDAPGRRNIRVFRSVRLVGDEAADEVEAATTRRAAMTDRKQRIEKIAYQLWEQEGRPDGHSERLWLAAEAQHEADAAKAKYEAEIAKDRAATKPAGAAKPKSEQLPAAPPAKPKAAAPSVAAKPAAPAAGTKPAAPAVVAKPAAPAGLRRRRNQPRRSQRQSRRTPTSGSPGRNNGTMRWRRVRSGKAI